MKTKQAVAFILKHRGLTKYRMSQDIGCAPVSVDQWLKRTRMGKQYAAKFYSLYKVEITDAV